MIRKSVSRFSEKIMLNQKPRAAARSNDQNIPPTLSGAAVMDMTAH
jgi:hypothetical protein